IRKLAGHEADTRARAEQGIAGNGQGPESGTGGITDQCGDERERERGGGHHHDESADRLVRAEDAASAERRATVDGPREPPGHRRREPCGLRRSRDHECSNQEPRARQRAHLAALCADSVPHDRSSAAVFPATTTEWPFVISGRHNIRSPNQMSTGFEKGTPRQAPASPRESTASIRPRCAACSRPHATDIRARTDTCGAVRARRSAEAKSTATPAAGVIL